MSEDRNLAKTICTLFMMLTLGLAASALAQTPAIWGELLPGQYGVGFTTVEKYDYSRTYRSGHDYFGNPVPGESERAIQICVWYPALETTGMIPVVYGEYNFPYPEQEDFVGLLSNLQGRELGILFGLLNADQALVQDVMSIELIAVRDAPAQEGSFPLIVYHSNMAGAFCQNATMCEYLASHGFIVAATHSVGTADLNPAEEPEDLEAIVRDKEFVVAEMRDFPNVDSDRLGLLGYGSGGLTALVHQMRNTNVTAVASLHGSFLSADGIQLADQCAFFNAMRMQAPFLNVYAEDSNLVDKSLVDSLKYSDRYSLKVAGLQSVDLTHYAVISTMVMDSTDTPPETLREGYETVCLYILNFFRALLTQDETSLVFIGSSPVDNGVTADFLSTTFAGAEEVPPTANQLVNVARNYGVDRAIELCEKFGLADPANPLLPGPTITALGYEYLYQRRSAEDAIKLFKMGVEAYPNSANAWDSYGEACRANGNNELALTNYRKALEMLPSDSTINPGLANAIRTNAPTVIEELENLITGESEDEQ